MYSVLFPTGESVHSSDVCTALFAEWSELDTARHPHPNACAAWWKVAGQFVDVNVSDAELFAGHKVLPSFHSRCERRAPRLPAGLS